MASIKLRLSYQKLRKKQVPELDEDGWEEEEEEEEEEEGGGDQDLPQQAMAVGRKSGGWLRLGRPSQHGQRRRRRGRERGKLRILSLRRLLLRRARLVRASLGRVVRRLVEGRSQLGDLFAGNYVFVQVSPASLRCLQKYSFPAGRGVALPPSWYCLPGVA